MSHCVLRRRLILSLPALAVLSACGEGGSASSREFGIPKQQPLSVAAIEKFATGFDVGAVMSRRRVFVFFDPQCPHCARFWLETKQLASQARFTWMPVSILNRASLAQGATILAAPSPAAAMDEHEAAFTSSGGRGGISAADVGAQFKAAVTKNTRLFESFSLAGVPFVVAEHARTGALFSRQGGLPADQLAQTLGW